MVVAGAADVVVQQWRAVRGLRRRRSVEPVLAATGAILLTCPRWTTSAASARLSATTALSRSDAMANSSAAIKRLTSGECPGERSGEESLGAHDK